jgi:hypothetical protein
MGILMIEISIFCRITRILTTLRELKIFKIIFDTMLGLARPYGAMLTTLLLFYFIFASIGMYLFGGIINA